MLEPAILTPADLTAAGFSPREIRRRIATGGDLHVLARGVYVDRATWDAASEPARHLLSARAVLLLADPDCVLSHGTAAIASGLATLRISTQLVHVTRPGLGTGKRRSTHQLHGSRLDEVDVTTIGGLRATAPARTVADVARCDGWLPGLVVADQALRAGVTRETLANAFARQRGLPGSACLDRLLGAADRGADNPGESLARAALLEAIVGLGLPAPETQFRIDLGGREAYADLRVGRLLIEFDGRWKYARDRPFGDGEPPSEVLWNEKRREERLRALGYHVVRLCWSDLFGPARARTISQLREAAVRHSGLI